MELQCDIWQKSLHLVKFLSEILLSWQACVQNLMDKNYVRNLPKGVKLWGLCRSKIQQVQYLCKAFILVTCWFAGFMEIKYSRTLLKEGHSEVFYWVIGCRLDVIKACKSTMLSQYDWDFVLNWWMKSLGLNWFCFRRWGSGLRIGSLVQYLVWKKEGYS